jgi:signal transduction histidine kinase
MASELLVREAEKLNRPELSGLAEDARVAAWRCNALVNELLDLGRLDADRLQLRTGTTALAAPLSEAIAMARAHHGPRELRIEGRLDAAVLADPERLKVILRNLVDNAFKYSPTESLVSVTVSEGEDRVRLDIRDEGVGVPKELRERIFQRFERLSAPEHVSGVGIGLFLSRELARRMNGEIRCRDAERGAAFELELPLSA